MEMYQLKNYHSYIAKYFLVDCTYIAIDSLPTLNEIIPWFS